MCSQSGPVPTYSSLRSNAPWRLVFAGPWGARWTRGRFAPRALVLRPAARQTACGVRWRSGAACGVQQGQGTEMQLCAQDVPKAGRTCSCDVTHRTNELKFVSSTCVELYGTGHWWAGNHLSCAHRRNATAGCCLRSWGASGEKESTRRDDPFTQTSNFRSL